MSEVQRLRERYRREGRVFPPQPWHIGRREYAAALRADERAEQERLNQGVRGAVRRWLHVDASDRKGRSRG